MFPRPLRVSHFRGWLAALLLSAASLPAAIFTVQNANDAGAGSLRQAILDANASSGSDSIFFAASLNGQTITLTTGTLSIATPGVTIDASNLSRGLTISGGDAVRIFNIAANSGVQLTRLRLVHGSAGSGNNGGAIQVTASALTLTDCTFTDNAAGNLGGALYASGGGSVTAANCTFDRNVASDSGAIYLDSSQGNFFSNCTITANRGTSTSATGAVTVSGSAGATTFTHCTVFANVGVNFGGGLFAGAAITLNRCIVAGNIAAGTVSPDVFNASTITAVSNNLIGSNGGTGNGNVSAEFAGPSVYVGVPGALRDPLLRPLGPAGGPTWTLAPHTGSVAIEGGGATSPFSTDQRGFPRVVNGGTALGCDLGAVERGPILTVTNVNDSGAGSLRATLAAVTQPDTRVQFASATSGATIVLTSTFLAQPNGSTVEIDGSTLTSPLTVSGGGQRQVFSIPTGANLALNRLTVTAGRVVGAAGGAAVGTQGGTFLGVDCTFSGHTTDTNGGCLTLIANAAAAWHRCTFSANTSASGAVYVQDPGRFLLSNCTISGNTGGGVVCVGGSGSSPQSAELELVHCTITGNTGNAGLATTFSSSARIERCLIAGNTGPASPDISRFTGTVTNVAPNFIGNNGGSGNANVSAEFPAGALVGTPAAPLAAKLGPLTRAGGPTAVHLPLQGSPAIDAAGFSLASTDQRGLPRNVSLSSGAVSDLGAVERGVAFTITSASDSGAGSLRTTLNLTTGPDTRLVFDASLNGQSISLTSGPLALTSAQNISLDASALPNGIRIAANATSRVFEVPAGAVLTAQRIGISGGVNAGQGGGILSSGTVSLYACDLFGNQAADGGGLFAVAGTAELIGCRVASNFSSGAGAAQLGRSSVASVTATHCWFGTNNPSGGNAFTNGVVFTPFISFVLTPSPVTIPVGSSTTLTASVAQNENLAAVGVENLIPLIGRAVAFNTAVNGTLSNAQVTIQANGKATATFTATASGTGSTNAVFDGVNATTNINISAVPTPTVTPTPTRTPTPAGPTLTPTPTPTPTPVGPTNTPIPTATPTPTPTPTIAPAKLINVSTRLRAGVGEGVPILGFVISGGSKTVAVRAVGPNLANFGVPNVLENPTLELVRPTDGVTLVTNDNWQDNATTAGQLSAANLALAVPLESGTVQTLAAGSYTAIVRGVGNTVGNCLVEIYDLATGSGGRLVNLSTRGPVGTGDNVMIAGIVIGPGAPRRFLIRSLGPSLEPFGVTDPLADPTLEVTAGATTIGTNDDWQSAQRTEIMASGFAPTNPLEPGIILTLGPGSYTAIVRGLNGLTGNAIVEVYELP